MFTIARHLLADRRRDKSQSQQTASLDDVEPASPDGSALDAILESEYAQQVRDCLGRLPARERELLRRRSEGEKPADMVVDSGLNADQISRLLYNAKQRMIDCLGHKRDDP